MQLKEQIIQMYETSEDEAPEGFYELFQTFLEALNSGEIRSAEKLNGTWNVHTWVKKGILLGFKYGNVISFNEKGSFSFHDKHTYPTQKPNGTRRNIRIVPGGSTVRTGAYIGNSVTMMPPMYVNAGAYVDDGTMIDSHALVGSCAQVGKNVHLSAAAQLGGVLEPVGALPVIVEDECLIGGNTGIYEGTRIGQGAVIGAGVILTKSTPVYDLVKEEIYRAKGDIPLHIPEGAVVIPGSRSITNNNFAQKHKLSISSPIIIKYRDEKTDTATTLENLLR